MYRLESNYHTHTPRCHHAKGSEREYIEAAIASGIKILGFSDHIPLIFKDGHEANYSVHYCDVEDYFTSLNALRNEYKNDIEIHIGFEAEYYPEYFEENLLKLKKYEPEYLILGQHFISKPFTDDDNFPYVGSPFLNPHFLTQYVDNVIAALQTGKFTYLAHPDLPNFKGDKEIYKMEMARICKLAKELNIPLEFNLLGFSKGRNYPSKSMLEVAKQYQNDIILGIDAHDTKQIADLSIVSTAMDYLKSNFDIVPIKSAKLINPYN